MFEVQGSLLDLGDVPQPGPLGTSVTRTELSDGAWVDLRRGWMTGSQPLFDRLAAEVPWVAERRHMYERMIDVPRLVCFFAEDARLPDPALVGARAVLDEHYGDELGEPFATVGMCLYRDGNDSVAWHGDTIGRGSTEDTMVAILSLGSPRTLRLRPRMGGTSLGFQLNTGDLLVMGGSCQRTWQHSIPKTTKAAGARISVQFRPAGVR
ncbi:MAG: alpha-ketoglutarate-dependent dioxygenase AlkB [Acidimicrobiales bacterium]